MLIPAPFRPQPHTASATMLIALALFASGCSTTSGIRYQSSLDGKPDESGEAPVSTKQELPSSAARELATQGIKAMDARDYVKASALFNRAVKTDMSNSYLHLLNGVAYQMRGMAGESNLLPLAEQGFEMAVQFDKSNWLARYYSGLLSMQQRDFAKAQKKLAEAALYAPDEPELLYNLAVTSYYNQDPRTAAAALEGLRRQKTDLSDYPRILRASAIVAAALNDKVGAQFFVSRLRETASSSEDFRAAESRVTHWLGAYQRDLMVKTQYGAGRDNEYPKGSSSYGSRSEGSPSERTRPGELPTGGMGSRSDFIEKQMAVVDVSIISTEEDNTHAMGVNLLDGLKIQFGNPAVLTPGFSRLSGSSQTRDLTGLAGNTDTQNAVITRLIQVPALTYTLNIANANTKSNEVLARPTLVAMGNQPSNFFSGQDIVGAAVSGGQGSSVQIQKEVGVKLSVTPEFMPDNFIKLNVVAERTFLAIPSTSVKFDFRLDTNKTMVNANVVMKFGETLILSGLSERDQSKDRDGVPFLQDLPIAQYLFSRKVTRDYYKSVLILLTPRRAQYTNRDEAAVTAERASMTPDEVVMAEFEDKYKPWFKPLPNVAEITKSLEAGTLYREFRTGDLASSWQRIAGHDDRLKTVLNFLYY
jgi:Flp pilus assembly protein TadD